ncbi:hypothetical protein, partial [Micromonospora harpali]
RPARPARRRGRRPDRRGGRVTGPRLELDWTCPGGEAARATLDRVDAALRARLADPAVDPTVAVGG